METQSPSPPIGPFGSEQEEEQTSIHADSGGHRSKHPPLLLHLAAESGDAATIDALVAGGAMVEGRDEVRNRKWAPTGQSSFFFPLLTSVLRRSGGSDRTACGVSPWQICGCDTVDAAVPGPGGQPQFHRVDATAPCRSLGPLRLLRSAHQSRRRCGRKHKRGAARWSVVEDAVGGCIGRRPRADCNLAAHCRRSGRDTGWWEQQGVTHLWRYIAVWHPALNRSILSIQARLLPKACMHARLISQPLCLSAPVFAASTARQAACHALPPHAQQAARPSRSRGTRCDRRRK
jgi:hypothetical protein